MVVQSGDHDDEDAQGQGAQHIGEEYTTFEVWVDTAGNGPVISLARAIASADVTRFNNKFFILAYDMFSDRYHVVDLHQHQANKLIKACDGEFENIWDI